MAIKQIEWAFFLREDFPPKLSGELRVRNTKPACPPTFRYYFIPPHQQERKGEKQTKKGKKKKPKTEKTVQETLILLENSSMLHTSESKGVGW